MIVDLSSLLLALLIMIPVWRRLGEHYALLITLGMIVPVASSTQSLSRYVLVLFPVFMMLAWWGRRRLLGSDTAGRFCHLAGRLHGDLCQLDFSSVIPLASGCLSTR